jgi:hypothetical protein
VEFVTARLDEDEQLASAAGSKVWAVSQTGNTTWVTSPPKDGETKRPLVALSVNEGERAHIARHSPARVLAEVDAKRRILAPYADALAQRERLRARMREVIHKDHDEFSRLHRQETELFEMGRMLRPVIAALALPYADHPHYDEAWRP